jgi:uncharacterized protein (TIRG00374 family)
MNPLVKKILLFCVGLLALAGFIYWADLGEITRAFASISLGWLGGTMLLQFLTIALITWQWQLIAGHTGCKVPFMVMLHIIMAGTFVESVTPAVKAGGEAAKVLLLKSKAGLATSQAVAITGAQKVISTLPFLALNLLALPWFLSTVELDKTYTNITVTALAFLTLFTLLLGLALAYPGILTRFSKAPALHQGIRRFRGTLTGLAKPRKLTPVLSLSLVIWLLFALKAWLLGIGLGITPGFTAMAVITWLSYVVGMVPLLPGGMGAMEGSTVLLLAPLGITLAPALALALVIRFVTFWFPFLLSALWLTLSNLGLATGDRDHFGKMNT